MYENEAGAVRIGIEFLTALNEKDYLQDPTFDSVDLESQLSEIQADVNNLISNLPFEAVDDEEERELEYTGDFEDSEELEDEIVECERLIAQATHLIAAVREHYLPKVQITEEASKESVAKQIEQVSAPQGLPSPSSKKKKLDNVSEFQLYFILLLVIIAIITLIIEG